MAAQFDERQTQEESSITKEHKASGSFVQRARHASRRLFCSLPDLFPRTIFLSRFNKSLAMRLALCWWQHARHANYVFGPSHHHQARSPPFYTCEMYKLQSIIYIFRSRGERPLHASRSPLAQTHVDQSQSVFFKRRIRHAKTNICTMGKISLQ
jgi:hypothetical protein